jgi:hypothetical protein
MYPQPFLKRLEVSTRAIVERVNTMAKTHTAQTRATSCLQLERSRLYTLLQGTSYEHRRGPVPCREFQGTTPETEG